MQSGLICSRCSHANDPRARYCANCGLSLITAARPVSAPPVRPAARSRCCRTGTWLVLLMVSSAVVLAGMAFVYHARTAHRRPAIRHIIHEAVPRPGIPVRTLQYEFSQEPDPSPRSR